MRVRVLEKGTKLIEEAYSLVARYEANGAGSKDLSSASDGGLQNQRVSVVNESQSKQTDGEFISSGPDGVQPVDARRKFDGVSAAARIVDRRCSACVCHTAANAVHATTSARDRRKQS